MEAIQWTGKNWRETRDFLQGFDYYVNQTEDALLLDQSVGMSVARIGDYLVKDMGGVYATPKAEFERAYGPEHDDMPKIVKIYEDPEGRGTRIEYSNGVEGLFTGFGRREHE